MITCNAGPACPPLFPGLPPCGSARSVERRGRPSARRLAAGRLPRATSGRAFVLNDIFAVARPLAPSAACSGRPGDRLAARPLTSQTFIQELP